MRPRVLIVFFPFLLQHEHHWEDIPKHVPVCLLSFFSCVQLWDPMDHSPPGSPVHGSVSRQEYWRGLPCPPPGDLLDPGLEPVSLTSPALVGRFFFITSTIWEALPNIYFYQNVSHAISVFFRKAIVQKSFTWKDDTKLFPQIFQMMNFLVLIILAL